MELQSNQMRLKFDSDKLRELIEPLMKANKGVKVGILENATNADTGMSIAEYAYYNEFGTKNIPARPFFRNAISENADIWAEVISSNIKNKVIVDPNIVERALARMGALAKSDIQQSISKGDFKPLAESTVKKKGKSTPLIDSRDMFNAIDYEVVDGD